MTTVDVDTSKRRVTTAPPSASDSTLCKYWERPGDMTRVNITELDLANTPACQGLCKYNWNPPRLPHLQQLCPRFLSSKWSRSHAV